MQPPQTLDQLTSLLSTNNVDLSRWGSGNAKTTADLWQELVNDEITLSQNPLQRRLRIVTVRIRHGALLLTELEQRFHDGRTRSRDLPPSEKMKAGESYQDAAIRCLGEELHVLPEHILILNGSHQIVESQRESYSYPTLESIYEQHLVDVIVPILPSADFLVSNNAADGSDPVASHLWGWRPVSN